MTTPLLWSEMATAAAINGISNYVQRSTHEVDWRRDLLASDHRKLHTKIKDRVAPSLVHDLMVQISVFGNSERSAHVAKAWFDRLPQEAWCTWFDLNNVISSTKRTYGHEVLRRAASNGDVAHDPLAKLLIEHGFLSSPRGAEVHGPLFSILANGDEFTEADAKVLLFLIAAEKRVPGCCLTPEAQLKFSVSGAREQAISASLTEGLDVRRWVHPTLAWSESAQRLNDLSLAVEARKAANEALHAHDFFASPILPR